MLAKIDNYLLKKFGKREKMHINDYIVKYKTVWAIIFVLNLMDSFATLVAIRNPVTHEINPIMKILLSSPPGFIIIKMILVCVLFIIIYDHLSQFGRIHNMSCWYIIIFCTGRTRHTAVWQGLLNICRKIIAPVPIPRILILLSPTIPLSIGQPAG